MSAAKVRVLEARIARLRVALHDIRTHATMKPGPVTRADFALWEDDVLARGGKVDREPREAWNATRADVRNALCGPHEDRGPALDRLVALIPEDADKRRRWVEEMLRAGLSEGTAVERWHRRYDAAIRAGASHDAARAAGEAGEAEPPPPAHRCDLQVERDLRQQARETAAEQPNPYDVSGACARQKAEHVEALTAAAALISWGHMSHKTPKEEG